MLYDILPPIILFMSLGGIIVVVSRVVLRLRRQQFSEHMKNDVSTSSPVKTDKLFQPAQKGVEAIRNRMGLMTYYTKKTGEYVKKTSGEAKQSWQERKERKAQAREEKKIKEPVAKEKSESENELTPVSGIELPTNNWKDRIANIYIKGVAGTKEMAGNLKSKVITRMEERAAQKEEDLKTTTLSLEEDNAQTTPEEASISKIRVTRIDNSKSDLLKSVMKKEEEKSAKAKEEEVKKQASAVGMLSQFLKREEKKEPVTTLEIAEDALKSGQYQRAEDLLVPYIIQYSRDTKAYMLLGRTALARQTWDEAIEIFEQVIKINPKQKGGYAALGFAAYKAGRFTRALQALQRAHDDDPTNIKVLNNLLAIAERMDNQVLQRSVLEDLAVLEPDKKEYQQKLEAMQEKIRA